MSEELNNEQDRYLTFDERYELYKKHRGIDSDKTFEEGGGNSYGKITMLDIMDDDGIPKKLSELSN